MIQDIFPSRLDNSYAPYDMRDSDSLFFFDASGKVLLGGDDGQIELPSCAEARGRRTVYLFSIDDRRYFLAADCCDYARDGFRYLTIREARDLFQCNKEIFAVFTAWHLWRWYSDNRYCGRCACELEFDAKERALRCPKCGNIIYPRINPAVIVGVTKGDSLLITRYRNGYSHNALVAGFTEIGETLEQTVEREVMEETGIKVCNIRYYKSQPWGMAQDILTGFFCEAVGDDDIRMDENELRYAQWVPRAEIVLQPNNLSLTNEMMSMFKEGKA